MEILEQIEQETERISELKKTLIRPIKLQLHSGLAGYESPNSFGIYRGEGGSCLGVVGKNFHPMNLEMFLDSFIHSIYESNLGLDVNKITYDEYKEGKKIAFTIPLRDYELKESPMRGDILSSKIKVTTGFDGKTIAKVTHYTLRLWCTNGAAGWTDGHEIKFKNTEKNHKRMLVFTDNLLNVNQDVENYMKQLGSIANLGINDTQINAYIRNVFGINNDDQKLHTRTKRILDKINESVAIEMNNTGKTAYSLLQGITRYLTHEVSDGSEEDLIFGGAAVINKKAHQLIFSMN